MGYPLSLQYRMNQPFGIPDVDGKCGLFERWRSLVARAGVKYRSARLKL
jgi:hypothetical protein